MTIPPVPPAPSPSDGDGDDVGEGMPPQGPASRSPYGVVTPGDPSPAAPVPAAQPSAASHDGAVPSGPAAPPFPSAGPHPAGPHPAGPGDANPYAPQPYGAQGTAPSRGMSVAALILGAAGMVFSWFLLGIPSILAIVFGHIGLRREPAGRGLAIAGLVLGYVAVAIFLLWMVFFLASAVLGFAGW